MFSHLQTHLFGSNQTSVQKNKQLSQAPAEIRMWGSPSRFVPGLQYWAYPKLSAFFDRTTSPYQTGFLKKKIVDSESKMNGGYEIKDEKEEQPLLVKVKKTTAPIELSEEAENFFSELRRKKEKITLHFVVSYQKKIQQWGEGFQRFIQWVNQNSDVIQKVIFVDTAYLNRYNDPVYGGYKSKKLEGPWYETNKPYIAQLKPEVSHQVKTWGEYLLGKNRNKVKQLKKNVVEEFQEDTQFRELIVQQAQAKSKQQAHQRKGKNYESNNESYIREECLQYRLMAESDKPVNQSELVILYPGNISPALNYYQSKHHLPIRRLSYQVPNVKPSSESSEGDTCKGMKKYAESSSFHVFSSTKEVQISSGSDRQVIHIEFSGAGEVVKVLKEVSVALTSLISRIGLFQGHVSQNGQVNYMQKKGESDEKKGETDEKKGTGGPTPEAVSIG